MASSGLTSWQNVPVVEGLVYFLNKTASHLGAARGMAQVTETENQISELPCSYMGILPQAIPFTSHDAFLRVLPGQPDAMFKFCCTLLPLASSSPLILAHCQVGELVVAADFDELGRASDLPIDLLASASKSFVRCDDAVAAKLVEEISSFSLNDAEGAVSAHSSFVCVDHSSALAEVGSASGRGEQRVSFLDSAELF